jgi:hypothetical protein
MSHPIAIRTLPWGEEIYTEVSLMSTKSQNKFYARHGKNAEGKEYVEFTKFGPRPNTENENYVQKLRLYSPRQWTQLMHCMEGELSASIGWDMHKARQDFEASLTQKPEAGTVA